MSAPAPATPAPNTAAYQHLLASAMRTGTTGGLLPLVRVIASDTTLESKSALELLKIAFSAAAVSKQPRERTPDQAARVTVMPYLPWFEFDYVQLVRKAADAGVLLALFAGQRAQKKRTFADVTAENFREYRYREVPLWPVTNFAFCFQAGVMPEEADFANEAHRGSILQLFSFAAGVIDEARDFFFFYEPDTILIARGYDVLASVLRHLAIESGVRVVTFENVFHRERLVWEDISGISVNRNLSKSYFWRYEDAITPEQASASVENYFASIATLKSAEHRSPALAAALPVGDTSTPTIVYLGQVGIDSSVFYGRMGFASQVEIIRTVASYAAEHGCRLIVKLHPKENPALDSVLPIYHGFTAKRLEADAEFQRARAKLGDRLVIDQENRLNTYDLIRAANVCITLNSQAGLEALALGKEVIVCGNCFYGGLGFTQEAPDAPALTFSLGRVLCDGLRRNDGVSSRKFFHIFADLYCLPKTEQSLIALAAGRAGFPSAPRFKSVETPRQAA